MDKKILLIAVVMAVILVAAFFLMQKPGPSACGDSKCDTGEDKTCPQDCGMAQKCAKLDQSCSGQEGAACCEGLTCFLTYSYPESPGKCRPAVACSKLGGVICSMEQSCAGAYIEEATDGICCNGTCEQIGGTSQSCGNGQCEKGENKSCPQDCNAPPSTDYQDSPFGIYWSLHFSTMWWSAGLQETSDFNKFDFTKADAQFLELINTRESLLQTPIDRINPHGFIGIFNRIDQCTCYNDSTSEFFIPKCAQGGFAPGEKGPLYKYCSEANFVNYIKKTVERYDGDNDYGCSQQAPDCYTPGDRQYPSQELRQAITAHPEKIWQTMNEPEYGGLRAVPESYGSIKQYPQLREVTVREYFKIQKVAYNAIKSVCSDCKVATAGFSHGANLTPEWTRGVGAWQYISSEIQNGGKDYFDIYNFHVYIDYREIPNTVREINRIAPGKQFVLTELGCSTNAGNIGDPCRDEKKQAEFLLKSMASGAGEKYIFLEWFLYQDSPDTDTGFNNHGLISMDGTKKLSYYTYKFLDEKLKNSDWSQSQRWIDGNNSGSQYSNVYSYKFINKQTQKPTYVVWWDYWNEPKLQTKQVTISVSIAGTAKITQGVPHFENGLLLQQSGQTYPAFFDTETKQVVNGQVTLQLGKDPVYIEQA